MPKKSLNDWHNARVLWESSPGMGFAEVARTLGVSTPTVFIRAQRDNWTKLAPALDVDGLAQVRADVTERLVSEQSALIEGEIMEALDLSVRSRVSAINRWRNDWRKHRELFPHETMASDATAARRAKAAAEAMMIRQRGEAVAFGLSTMTGSDTNAPLVEADPDPDRSKSKMDRDLEYFVRTGRLPQDDEPPLLEDQS